MQDGFGTLIFTKPERAISDVKYAEERGFSHAWIPDSHMIWGDAYARTWRWRR
jgi:alkanesulfonate monooxygenase SsuD/methylene tetrahydromethanopterin reductase-like flavin-dependent oxidoreductase (luciferase family)